MIPELITNWNKLCLYSNLIFFPRGSNVNHKMSDELDQDIEFCKIHPQYIINWNNNIICLNRNTYWISNYPYHYGVKLLNGIWYKSIYAQIGYFYETLDNWDHNGYPRIESVYNLYNFVQNYNNGDYN